MTENLKEQPKTVDRSGVSALLSGDLSDDEATIVAITRINKAEKKREIRKSRTVMGVTVRFSWRAKSNLWGRFGGGWNWKFGFQAGGNTIIFSFFVCDLSISRARCGIVTAQTNQNA